MASFEAFGFRLTAWAGVALSIMMVAGFALDIGIIVTTGAEPLIRPDHLSEDLSRVKTSAIWPAEGWIYTLLIVPASLFALGVFWRLRDEGDEALTAVGLLAFVLFWVIHTVHNVAILAVVQGLAPTYVPGAPDAPAIESAARGWISFSGVLFAPGGGVGSLFWAMASLAFGRALLEAKRLPRWLGYLSIGSGVFALLGLSQYAYGPLVALGLVGWILFIAMIAAFSFSMLREPVVASSAPRPPDA